MERTVVLEQAQRGGLAQGDDYLEKAIREARPKLTSLGSFSARLLEVSPSTLRKSSSLRLFQNDSPLQ